MKQTELETIRQALLKKKRSINDFGIEEQMACNDTYNSPFEAYKEAWNNAFMWADDIVVKNSEPELTLIQKIKKLLKRK